MKHILKAVLPLLGVILATGCAKEVKTQANYANKLYFDAWLHVNYPGAVESGNGIYVLEDIPGSGAAWNADDDLFAYVDYTATDLEHVVSSTTLEPIARKTGLYNVANYYGPIVQIVSENSCPVGVEDALKGMRLGGTRTVAIPSWLMTEARFDSKEKYLDQTTQNSHAIYTLTLRQKIRGGDTNGVSNIYKWEADSLDRYFKKHYGADADSTAYTSDEGSRKFGFYFKSLSINLTEKGDTIHTNPGSSYKLNYTGRLLNGKVFDTTVADTAKVYGIYSATRSYGPVSINWGDKYSDLTMGDSETSLKEGFSMGVFRMHPGEKAVVGFYSSLGYGPSGSGGSIPGFSPLIFELELMEED